jgi:hypothetical protein
MARFYEHPKDRGKHGPFLSFQNTKASFRLLEAVVMFKFAKKAQQNRNTQNTKAKAVFGEAAFRAQEHKTI